MYWRMVLSLRFRVASMAAVVLISGCAITRKPPPYRDPDRLVSVIKVAPTGEEPVLDTDFLTWRNQSQTLQPITAYVFGGFDMADRSTPARIVSARVSSDFFHTLGVNPLLGRAFTSDDCKPGGNHVVVISRI